MTPAGNHARTVLQLKGVSITAALIFAQRGAEILTK
jgi:hypothetical protein